MCEHESFGILVRGSAYALRAGIEVCILHLVAGKIRRKTSKMEAISLSLPKRIKNYVVG